GQTTALAQQVWGTPLQQLMAAYTSMSELDAVNRPDLLLEPMSFFLQDGTPVEWPGLTTDLVRDLIADPAMAPMILAILGPTTFDQTVEEGQASLQAMTDASLVDIVTNPDQIRTILSGESFADQMRFASM